MIFVLFQFELRNLTNVYKDVFGTEVAIIAYDGSGSGGPNSCWCQVGSPSDCFYCIDFSGVLGSPNSIDDTIFFGGNNSHHTYAARSSIWLCLTPKPSLICKKFTAFSVLRQARRRVPTEG